MIMCSFEHNLPLVHPMRRISTKLYQLRNVTTCTFSLKRRISALVWLTWTPPCATFDICGHVWAESFHCFAHCERTMRCVHCETTCVYITFRLTKTCMETAHNHGLVCQKMRTDTSFLTANMSHNAFTKSKTMETFHPDMSTFGQNLHTDASS